MGERFQSSSRATLELLQSSRVAHSCHLLCSTLLLLAQEPLQSWSPKFAFQAHPFGFAFAKQLQSGSTNHQFYNVKWSCSRAKSRAAHIKTLIFAQQKRVLLQWVFQIKWQVKLPEFTKIHLKLHPQKI